jgi:hypothetical protein
MTDHAPRQLRSFYGVDDVPTHAMVVGDYLLWKLDGDDIGIGYRNTGEMGVFKKKDFEPYIAAFFGLNF